MDQLVDNMTEIDEMMAKWRMDISEVFPHIDVGDPFEGQCVFAGPFKERSRRQKAG